MVILQIPCWTDNYSYILNQDSKVLVIDPCDGSEIIRALKDIPQIQEINIANTHHHPDHIHGNPAILDFTQKTWNQAPNIYASAYDLQRIPTAQCPVKLTDEEYSISNFHFKKLATPGHTLGHWNLYFDDKSSNTKSLFCGDVLFSLGCGRVFEGSHGMTLNSLKKLHALPPDTQVFCAHEYTQDNFEFLKWSELYSDRKLDHIHNHIQSMLKKNSRTIPTSIAFENEFNPFLRILSDPELCHQIALKVGYSSFAPLDAFKALRQTRNQGPHPEKWDYNPSLD